MARARPKREREQREKYLEQHKNGYHLKICKTHGPLKYEDIHLIIRDTYQEKDRRYEERYRVWMSCKKCRHEQKLKVHNEGLEKARKLLDFLKCTKCDAKKSIRDFSSYMWSYRYPHCKSCVTEQRKKDYLKKAIKNRLAVTEEKYNEMLLKQNSLCEICGKEESHRHHLTKTLYRLAIDHNHQTGQIRDLLCRGCNLMIGNCQESSETLRKAADYLDRHNEGS